MIESFFSFAIPLVLGWALHAYAWPWLRTKIVGVETAINELEVKIKELRSKL